MLLVAALLAFGGSSAASLEVQQAGLVSAVLSTATSGRDSPVLELSPTGERVCVLGWLSVCVRWCGVCWDGVCWECPGYCRNPGTARVDWVSSRFAEALCVCVLQSLMD